MTTREQRLRKVVPGASGELVSALAARPAADVGLIVAALRQARRDERQHQADRRRQAKADARRHNHYDENQLADRNIRLLDALAERIDRLLDAQAKRAASDGNLDALASLAGFARHADSLISLAVGKLRDRENIPDEVIGRSLGISRQAVGQRFGRKGSFTAGDPPARTG